MSLQKLAHHVGYKLCKAANDATPVYHLAGRLYLSSSGWLLLKVPNSLGKGAFDALDEPGITLPTRDTDDPNAVYNAHISVMSAEEVESIGGGDKITERGHMFRYTLGPIKTVEPKTWNGVSKCWYITVYSPELRQLRKSYGLSPQPEGDWDFHITVGIRKTGVLHNNEKSKAASVKVAGYDVTIDRPKGFKKTFQTKAGPLEQEYPLDYGYFNGVINPQDNEAADVFVGSGGKRHGRFMKGTDLTGEWQPDEHKWYTGLTDDEHAELLAWWAKQNPDLIRDDVSFADEKALAADLAELAKQKSAEVDYGSLLNGHGRVVCEKCDKRLAGCRCKWNDETHTEVKTVCEDCRAKAAGKIPDDGWAGERHENCQHCGASMERGEEGYCNSCGRHYDSGLVPAKGIYHEGRYPEGEEVRKESAADILPGGLADGKPDSDFDPKQLAKGRQVEQEHTSLKGLPNEIAKDHLTEDPKYYDKLEKMEGKEASLDESHLLELLLKQAASTHTYTNNGATYDVLKLIEILKDRPTQLAALDALKVNRSRRTGYSPKRMAAANTTFPGIVNEAGQLVDGRHRAAKMIDHGQTHMPVRTATAADLKAARVKQSSSKLRALVQLVKNTPFAPTKYNGQLRQFQEWLLRLHGKDIGRITGFESPTGFQISESHIRPQFQGLGLGKKFYGELLKQAPQRTVLSDRQVSNEAARVWQGMAKRPGYQVTQSPAAVPIPGGLHTEVSRFNDVQQDAYQKTTPLLKRVFGLGKPAPIKTPEVFKAKLNIPA